MNLFDELKRRNIIRIAGIYAVVGWAFEMTLDGVKRTEELTVITIRLPSRGAHCNDCL